MNANESRRQFLKLGTQGLGLMALGPVLGISQAEAESEAPRFFLQIFFEGGMDASYLFDSRPLEMTKNGKIQNYLGAEPNVWEGKNGTVTLASSLIQPLETFRNDFSVLNGVLMAPTSIGHPQNINYLFTGSTFGGDSFIPYLNTQARALVSRPIDALQAGSLQLEGSNLGNVVPLNQASFQSLQQKLRTAPPLAEISPLTTFVRQRMSILAQGEGSFSIGAQNMSRAHQLSGDLSELLLKIPASGVEVQDSVLGFVSVALGCFKGGVTRSALLIPDFQQVGALDAHDTATAKAQPVTLQKAVNVIAKVFKALKETPYDQTRSFFDVTTILVSTEFGRTMKATKSSSVDETGTNHNPLATTLLVAGQGIRGGQVIGATDFQKSDEVLSKAHQSLDLDFLSTMGKPFDFATMKPLDLKPEVFDPTHYLTIDSVVNSLYSHFSVDERKMRSVVRNGPKAPILKGLFV